MAMTTNDGMQMKAQMMQMKAQMMQMKAQMMQMKILLLLNPLHQWVLLSVRVNGGMQMTTNDGMQMKTQMNARMNELTLLLQHAKAEMI